MTESNNTKFITSENTYYQVTMDVNNESVTEAYIKNNC